MFADSHTAYTIVLHMCRTWSLVLSLVCRPAWVVLLPLVARAWPIVGQEVLAFDNPGNISDTLGDTEQTLSDGA